MTNDELCDSVAIAVLTAMIQNNSCDFGQPISMLEQAYQFGIAAVQVKNNNGGVPDPTTPLVATVPPPAS